MASDYGVTAGEKAQQQQGEIVESIDLDKEYHAIGIPAVKAVSIFRQRDPKPVHHQPVQIFDFED